MYKVRKTSALVHLVAAKHNTLRQRARTAAKDTDFTNLENKNKKYIFRFSAID